MRLVFTVIAIAILFTQDALAVRRRAVRIPEPAMGPCPASIETPLFTVSPVAPEDFLAFRPLGFLSLPIHVFPAKHSSFSMTLPGGTPVRKPLRAPGRAWIREIWEASFSSGGRNYQLYLYPCNEVRVYFGHVAEISERLLAEFQASAPSCNTFTDGSATVTTCRRSGLSLPIAAGEILGRGPDTAGMDFGIADFRRQPAAFIVRDHYDFYYPYWASPLEYFEPGVRAVIEAKTGSVFGGKVRTESPIGGTFMQDVPNTMQGNWFTGGKYHRTSTDLTRFLAFGRDYVVPAQPVMAMGTSVKGLTMGLYSFSVSSSGVVNRDFDRVTADGQTYCYEQFLGGTTEGGLPLTQAQGTLMVALASPERLRLEFVPNGTCAAAAAFLFTANATEFER